MTPRARLDLLCTLRQAYRNACRIEVICYRRHKWDLASKWQAVQVELEHDINAQEWALLRGYEPSLP